MSNLHNAKDDILHLIFHENHYDSKDAVLSSFDQLLKEIESDREYSYQYLDAVTELIKEMNTLSFKEIKRLEEEYNLEESVVSLPEDSYDNILDETYLDNIYLIDEEEMPREYLIKGRVNYQDKRYVVLQEVDIESPTPIIVHLDEEHEKVDYVEDENLKNEIYQQYLRK